jgi:nitroreductase
MQLTQKQLDVLNDVVVDGQAWADNAKEESHILAKIARHEASYAEAVAKGNYKNRKQRDEAKEKARQEAYDNVGFAEKRRRSYPPIGDQLDALWKGGEDADAMKAIVNKVKSDNPKG